MRFLPGIWFITASALAQTFAALQPATTCGVAGNLMIDDTAAIQRCINAAPDDSEIIFPVGMLMKITKTINIHGRYGLRLIGQAGTFVGPSAGTPAPTFYWYGADGGTMFDINRSEGLLVEGLTFFTSQGFIGGTGGANIGINVDQTLPSGGTTTDDIFQRISVISGTVNPQWQGIVFAQQSPNNVEHMTVRDSNFQCSYGGKVGEGIVIGPGGFYNAKKHLYEHNHSISGCAIGIHLVGGSADIIGNNFDSNDINIAAHPVDPIRISDNNCENETQFYVGNLTAPVTLSNNRIASPSPPAGQGAIEITPGGSYVMTLQGNKFDDGDYMPIAFAKNAGGSLDSSGNVFPYTATVKGTTMAGLNTTAYVLTSRNDWPLNQDTTTYINGGGYFHKLGSMGFDTASQRWKMSNDATSTTATAGHVVVTEPANGITLAGPAALGTCGGGFDLAASSTGLVLTSASVPFTWADTGGYIHVNAGNGWTQTDYYIYAGSPHGEAVSDRAIPNSTGGSFTINRGRTILKHGGPGVADSLWVCVKDGSDHYAWRQVF